MRKGWEMKKMGEVLTIERGGSPRPIEKYITDSPDGINWIKISDATSSDRYIYETKEKITKDGLHKTRVVNDGDFILSNSMSFGRPYIMKTTGCIHDGWLVLKQNGRKIFESEFLYYLLSSPFVFQQFNSKAAGSTVRNLNIALVSSVNVPVPPLVEQQRIISILDEAFAAIATAKANAEQNLKNAKELFDCYLQGVFENKGEDWKEVTLKAITLKIGSGATPKGGNESYKSEGISLVRSMNVHDLEFREKNLAFIDEQQASELNNVTLQEKDVLLNITGASVARCCVMPTEYLPARVNQHVSIIRANQKIVSPVFLSLLLTSKLYKNQLLFTGEQGATRQAITKAQLEVFKVCIPESLAAQESIIHKLDALSKETKRLESIYRQKIKDLEEIKKSILQKAFAGELVIEKELV
ncbi:MAG: restriction endonuclease subunit S [Bacteroidota bacterium]